MLTWVLLTSFVFSDLVKSREFGGRHTVAPVCDSGEIFTGIESRVPFFKDVIAPVCYSVPQKLFKNENFEYHFDVHEELYFSVQCANEGEVIVAFMLEMTDNWATEIYLECAPLLDPDSIEKAFNKTSGTTGHTYVSCGESSAVTGIQFMKLGDKETVRVVLFCIKLATEEVKGDASTATLEV